MNFQLFCSLFISVFFTSLLHDVHFCYIVLFSDRETQIIFLHFLQTSRMFLSHSTKFKFRHSSNDRCCETKLSRMSTAFWGAALKRLVLLFARIKKKKKKAPSRRHISFLLADAKKGKKIHTPSLWKLHFDYLQHSSCFSSKLKEEKKWHPVASRKGGGGGGGVGDVSVAGGDMFFQARV
jgi:hypothetical protein